jgi:signal transduction histidine kinase
VAEAAVAAFPEIGSYVAVPVLLSDGTFFGTLCGVDPSPRNFARSQIELLTVLARLLATYIERDRELAERRRIEEELERLSRAKSDFVSIVSHEFRTALTGIQGFSEMMRDEEFTLEEMKEYSGDINRDAQRLNRLISELLDLDRMESGVMPLHLVRVDLNALVERVAGQARTTVPSHRIHLDLDEALPALVGDADKLVQVMSNLLSNAIKYSPDGGDVDVISRLEGDSAHVQVKDRGLGIAPDALEEVFERYRRLETAATRAIAGTGLGLPIVRQIVQMHGGRVWAESTLGGGSTFHVSLPLSGPGEGD